MLETCIMTSRGQLHWLENLYISTEDYEKNYLDSLLIDNVSKHCHSFKSSSILHEVHFVNYGPI